MAGRGASRGGCGGRTKPARGAGVRKSRQVPSVGTDCPGNCLTTRQCDSKHPRCTACASAGVQCNQEDRHRKTLTPRGHVERLEHQLLQCSALLRRHYPAFSLDDLDSILAREGIDVEPFPQDTGEAMQQFSPTAGPARGPPPMQAKGYPYPPPHMMPHGYPMAVPPPGYGPGAPYPMPLTGGMYHPNIHPAFQQPPPMAAHARSHADIKGQDPQSNDMSNTQVRLLRQLI